MKVRQFSIIIVLFQPAFPDELIIWRCRPACILHAIIIMSLLMVHAMACFSSTLDYSEVRSMSDQCLIGFSDPIPRRKKFCFDTPERRHHPSRNVARLFKLTVV
jgi:hypothetical protein